MTKSTVAHPYAAEAAIVEDGTSGADPADNWARLRAKPPGERRIAILLAIDPKHGTEPAETAIQIISTLRATGYRLGDMPEDATSLSRRLSAGPTNARPHAVEEESLSFAEYSAFFAALPPAVQQQVAARWGAAERDPFFRPGRLDCGRFAIPGFRAGNVAVLIEPTRGYDSDPQATDRNPPPHAYLAVCAWIADSFRADAVIQAGPRDPSDWLPAEVLVLSAEH